MVPSPVVVNMQRGWGIASGIQKRCGKGCYCFSPPAFSRPFGKIVRRGWGLAVLLQAVFTVQGVFSLFVLALFCYFVFFFFFFSINCWSSVVSVVLPQLCAISTLFFFAFTAGQKAMQRQYTVLEVQEPRGLVSRLDANKLAADCCVGNVCADGERL